MPDYIIKFRVSRDNFEEERVTKVSGFTDPASAYTYWNKMLIDEDETYRDIKVERIYTTQDTIIKQLAALSIATEKLCGVVRDMHEMGYSSPFLRDIHRELEKASVTMKKLEDARVYFNVPEEDREID